MDNNQTGEDQIITVYLIKLLRAVVRRDISMEPMGLTPGEFDALIKLAQSHQVHPIVAYGLLLVGGLNDFQEKQCRTLIYRAMMHYERLERELRRTCELLEEAGLAYMLLKGAVIRSFYPEPWMRTSGDIDILVKDTDGAVATLERNGYTKLRTSSHEVAMKSPLGIILEIHFRFLDKLPKAEALLNREWERMLPIHGTCRYEMEPELFWVFHIAHMAKHLIIRGCGIRFFVDTWLLCENLPFDAEKKKDLLKKSGLLACGEQVEGLSQVWFGERKTDDLLMELEQFVLGGGVFGSKSNEVKLQRSQSGNTVKYLILRIFKPYDKMVLKYPVLKKYPVLLPAFWVIRWLEHLVDGKKMRGNLQELAWTRTMDKDGIDATKWLFDQLELM